MENMRKTVWIALLASFCVLEVAIADDSSGSCDQMLHSFDFTYRQIALIDALGGADNSAPRATLRQLEILNHRVEQLILLGFLREHDCKLPKRPGGSALYILPSLKCAVEQKKGNYDSPDCSLSKWQPLGSSE